MNKEEIIKQFREVIGEDIMKQSTQDNIEQFLLTALKQQEEEIDDYAITTS